MCLLGDALLCPLLQSLSLLWVKLPPCRSLVLVRTRTNWPTRRRNVIHLGGIFSSTMGGDYNMSPTGLGREGVGLSVGCATRNATQTSQQNNIFPLAKKQIKNLDEVEMFVFIETSSQSGQKQHIYSINTCCCRFVHTQCSFYRLLQLLDIWSSHCFNPNCASQGFQSYQVWYSDPIFIV